MIHGTHDSLLKGAEELLLKMPIKVTIAGAYAVRLEFYSAEIVSSSVTPSSLI